MRNIGADTEILQVVVAVILNRQQEVLVSRRPAGKHLAGMLEFPGGKIEPGESPLEALKREIREEINLDIHTAERFQTIFFEYARHPVNLQIYRCTEFSREAKPLENQELHWLPVSSLKVDDFPPANRTIIRRLQLPEEYMITGTWDTLDEYRDRCRQALDRGVRQIQLRTRLNPDDYDVLARDIDTLCCHYQANLLLNQSTDLVNSLQQAGLHLNSQRLYEHDSRPITNDRLLSVSCHNLADIKQAERLQADLALLSPVKPTSSHPEATPIGWEQFTAMVQATAIPVYALGGMQVSDMQTALGAGAQGIAGISCFDS